MEYRILGPVEVTNGQGPVPLASRRERAVLAALVIGGGVVSSERLIDALWGDAPPRSAAKTLQNYVLKLRKHLGADAIHTQAPGYRIDDDAVVDADRFEQLLHDAGAARADGRPAEAAALLRDGLALWRGDPLDELVGWATAESEATRLCELRRVAHEELVDAELDCGHNGPMVAELEAMVVAEPLRERRWAMLMLALYRDGRQADALRTYQRARTLLGAELGVEPGPELRAMEQAVATHDPALDRPDDPDPGAGLDEGGDAAPVVGPPPYRGLEPFTADDHAWFFGRSELATALVDRSRRDGFVVVVGASGSGKSSLVRAGVVAAWPADAPEPVVVTITPGLRPFDELALASARHGDASAAELATRLRSTGDLTAALPRTPGAVVLVVDQFEEVFIRTVDPEERNRFVRMLVDTSASPAREVIVILALRADFYGHCGTIPELGARMDHASMLVRPMTPAELHDAVVGPAELAGLHVEPGLAELVVGDLGDEPGALPLLSHALLETWTRRSGRTLTVAGYRAAGGVRGAIAQTAEAVHAELDDEGRRQMRRIFLRLVEPGDGTDDLRRRVPRDDLALQRDGAATETVLRRLVNARLVTVDGDTVQIAHEALVREWPRLRRWLDDDRDGRRLHQHLGRAAHEWDELGRPESELYRGARLAAVTVWLEDPDHRHGLNPRESAFLEASDAHERAELRARGDRAQERERAHRRLRRRFVVTAVCLVVALVAVGAAVVQRDHAAGQADRARAARADADVSRLVAQSEALRTENPAVSALLAVEAHRMHLDAETEGALLAAVVADPRHQRTLPTGSADNVWAVPNTNLVLVQHRGRLTLWDPNTGRRTARIPAARIETAAVRADGLIAAVGSGGRVTFFDPRGRRDGHRVATGHHGEFASADFARDGTHLVVGFGSWSDPRPVPASDVVTLVDVRTRAVGPPVAGRVAGAMAVAFAPDGTTVAIGDANDRVAFRDTVTGAETGRPIAVGSPVDVLAFDPVRGRIAIGTTMTGTVVADTTTRVAVPGQPDLTGVGMPVYSPDGRFLAIGGSGPVRLFDAATLTELPSRVSGRLEPNEPDGAPLATAATLSRVAFLTDARIVAGGGGAPATLWDLRGTTLLDRAVPGAPTYVFPMADGRHIAAPDWADSVTLHRAGSLATLGPPLAPGPGAEPQTTFPATFAASYWDGSRIAVVNRSGLLQEYRTADRTPIGPTVSTGITPIYAVYSRDMRHIAIGGRQGEIRVLDLDTHRVRALRSPMRNFVLGLEFGPHGELLASDGGHVVRYDGATTSDPRLRDLTAAIRPNGFGMDLSPDGRVLAVSQGGTVAFFDAHSVRRVGAPVPVGAQQINWIAFDRTGRRLVTGDGANAARLVDVPGRRAIGPVLGDEVAGGGSVFSHDGRTLGTWTRAGGALMSLDPAVWRRDACALAGRNLTPAEWAKYRPGTARRPTCPHYS